MPQESESQFIFVVILTFLLSNMHQQSLFYYCTCPREFKHENKCDLIIIWFLASYHIFVVSQYNDFFIILSDP